MIYYTFHPSPIGTIRLRANDTGLVAVDHTNQQERSDKDWQQNDTHPTLLQAKAELNAYFGGLIREFHTPLAPQGTPFQLKVWDALRTIPYGHTASYSDIAEIIGNPKSVRAVGAANGRNPLSIFIPCHRIIGKNGKLTGYAGGIENKATLLDIEKNNL